MELLGPLLQAAIQVHKTAAEVLAGAEVLSEDSTGEGLIFVSSGCHDKVPLTFTSSQFWRLEV